LLVDKDISYIFTGVIGQRASGLLNHQNIDVVVGVPSEDHHKLASDIPCIILEIEAT